VKWYILEKYSDINFFFLSQPTMRFTFHCGFFGKSVAILAQALQTDFEMNVMINLPHTPNHQASKTSNSVSMQTKRLE